MKGMSCSNTITLLNEPEGLRDLDDLLQWMRISLQQPGCKSAVKVLIKDGDGKKIWWKGKQQMEEIDKMGLINDFCHKSDMKLFLYMQEAGHAGQWGHADWPVHMLPYINTHIVCDREVTER